MPVVFWYTNALSSFILRSFEKWFDILIIATTFKQPGWYQDIGSKWPNLSMVCCNEVGWKIMFVKVIMETKKNQSSKDMCKKCDKLDCHFKSNKVDTSNTYYYYFSFDVLFHYFFVSNEVSSCRTTINLTLFQLKNFLWCAIKHGFSITTDSLIRISSWILGLKVNKGPNIWN